MIEVNVEDCQIDYNPEDCLWYIIFDPEGQSVILYKSGTLGDAVAFMDAVAKGYLPVSIREVVPDPEIIVP